MNSQATWAGPGNPNPLPRPLTNSLGQIVPCNPGQVYDGLLTAPLSSPPSFPCFFRKQLMVLPWNRIMSKKEGVQGRSGDLEHNLHLALASSSSFDHANQFPNFPRPQRHGVAILSMKLVGTEDAFFQRELALAAALTLPRT